MHKRLGSGDNATVWQATRSDADAPVALKLINAKKVEKEPYQRFVRDGTEITEAEGRLICAQRYKVSAEVRAARRRAGMAQQLKKRAGRGSKESTKAAPASDPPSLDATDTRHVA